LLKNRQQGTPVIPVLVAEITSDGSFKLFDFGRVRSILPNAPHARQARANKMLSQLRYERIEEGKERSRDRYTVHLRR
jgi:hypothetical protein